MNHTIIYPDFLDHELEISLSAFPLTFVIIINVQSNPGKYFIIVISPSILVFLNNYEAVIVELLHNYCPKFFDSLLEFI